MYGNGSGCCLFHYCHLIVLPHAGKDGVCRLEIARASTVTLPRLPAGGDPASAQQHGPPLRALCIMLRGDRFLRKMVRVLVATAVREAVPGAGRHGGADDALLRFCLAPAPPPHGPSAADPVGAGAELGGGSGGAAGVGGGDDAELAGGAAGAGGGSSAALLGMQVRLTTAVPAPAEGLMFLGAGYEDADLALT